MTKNCITLRLEYTKDSFNSDVISKANYYLKARYSLKNTTKSSLKILLKPFPQPSVNSS